MQRKQPRRRLSHDELEFMVKRAQAGDKAAVEEILAHFEGIIRKISRGSLYIQGGDREDVAQEARIGLWQAIMQYDAEKGKDIGFERFAINVCAKRRIKTALTSAKRRNHPMNHGGQSLETPIYSSSGESSETLADKIPDLNTDLEKDVIEKQEFEMLDSALEDRLTSLELQCYRRYKMFDGYRAIAKDLRCKEKAVDNALTRVRHKAKALLISVEGEEATEDHPKPVRAEVDWSGLGGPRRRRAKKK
jgi:RNA polymerase sporulation-specific sigma factor